MLGLMLQNLRPADCFQNFTKADLLFHHVLLRVLRYTKRSGCRRGLDAFNCSLKLRCISLDHRAVRISRPPCLQKASGRKGRKTFGLRTFQRKGNKKPRRESGVWFFNPGDHRLSRAVSRPLPYNWLSLFGGRASYANPLLIDDPQGAR